MAGSNRVLENVVRTANSIQNPAGGFHMPDQVHTFHGAYHTHDRRAASTMAPAPRRRAARDRQGLSQLQRGPREQRCTVTVKPVLPTH